MGLGWIALLKSVPWSDVISNAPLVADGARKLWGAVAGNSAADKNAKIGADVENNEHALLPLAVLENRVESISLAVDDLHAQMLQSSELLTTLADQNSLLVLKLEQLHQRMRWVMAAATLAVIMSLGAMLAASSLWKH